VSRARALRILGSVCLLSNLAIGIWVGAADPTTGQKAVAMVLLVVLIGAGILCLARAAQLAQAESMAARTGAAQPPTLTDERE
jgi:hypothetical protein